MNVIVTTVEGLSRDLQGRAWSSGEGSRRMKPMKPMKMRKMRSLNRMKKNTTMKLKNMRKSLLMKVTKISVTLPILFPRCLLVFGDVIF